MLRIEDTDLERSTPENVDAILDGMAWLGLDADEGPYRQTERFDRYRQVAEEWLERGYAYRCYCTREELAELREHQMAAGEKTRYDGRWRDRSEVREGVDPVIRFKNPLDGKVVVEDLVRGRVEFDNAELDDLIIVRSDGTPTYNFTVVVDDADMEISHVIRGDDHLNNTPRQINMFKALGCEPPAFAHLPMILGADGAKLSKRHGAVDVRDYRDRGYLPEAMLNYLVRLGWSHGDQEIFTQEQMISLFDIADVNQSASAFNPEKLSWLNQQHIIGMSADTLGPLLVPFLVRAGYDLGNGPSAADVAEAFHERAETLVQMAEACRFCFEDFDRVDEGAAKKHLRPVVLDLLRVVGDRLAGLTHWTAQAIEQAIRAVADDADVKMGKIGQPLRVAVTGGSVSPPIDVTLALVGRSRTIERIGEAVRFIEARMADS